MYRQSTIIFFISFLSFFFSSCNSQQSMKRSAEKNQEQANELREERESKRYNDYEAGLQKHYDMQTPKTKREMRRNIRNAERFNKHKPDFFLVRWYKSIFSPTQKKTRRKSNT